MNWEARYPFASFAEADHASKSLVLAANSNRPVAFHGVLNQSSPPLKACLRAIADILSMDDRNSRASTIVNPYVTITPDRILFEVIRSDGSTYGCLILDSTLFDLAGETLCGTSTVTFGSQLIQDCLAIRTPLGFTLQIQSTDVSSSTRSNVGGYLERTNGSEPWLRKFLWIQRALASVKHRAQFRPAVFLQRRDGTQPCHSNFDLWTIDLHSGSDARFLANSQNASEYSMGAPHDGVKRMQLITSGHWRTETLRDLVAFADSAEMLLSDSDQPIILNLQFSGMNFVLADAGFVPTNDADQPDSEMIAKAHASEELLMQRGATTVADLAAAMGVDSGLAERLLLQLAFGGVCLFDPVSNLFRYRPLVDNGVREVGSLQRPSANDFAIDEIATRMVVESCDFARMPRLGPLRHSSFRSANSKQIFIIRGKMDDGLRVQIHVDAFGELLDGHCDCAHFVEHLFNHGPCNHMAALQRIGRKFQFETMARYVEVTGSAPVRTHPCRDDLIES